VRGGYESRHKGVRNVKGIRKEGKEVMRKKRKGK